MNTKNILKSLAFAMLMPAMLFTTSCSNEDVVINNGDTAKQVYKIPVTVNVTRQGDKATTRATYDATTRKLSFSAGDKLFVKGNDDRAGGVGAGYFAGTLEYVDGSEGTFSGTINFVVSSYTGTIDDAFANGEAEATLLPAGYEQNNYIYFNDPDTWYTEIHFRYQYAIAGDLATAVEQFSRECGEYTSGTGFALAPQNAIINFTLNSGLAEGTSITPYLLDGAGADDYGDAVELEIGAGGIINFAMAVRGNHGTITWELADFDYNLDDIDLGTKNLVAGHIYNWTNVPAGPTTVTWNSSNISDLIFWGGTPDPYDSYTEEGVTLRGNAEGCDAEWVDFGGQGIMFSMNPGYTGGYTFIAPDGKKFTKIEITATTYEGWYTYAYFSQLESGWPSGEEAAADFNSTLKFTWTGSAASVNLATTLESFGPSLASSIEFTLE